MYYVIFILPAARFTLLRNNIIQGFSIAPRCVGTRRFTFHKNIPYWNIYQVLINLSVIVNH